MKMLKSLIVFGLISITLGRDFQQPHDVEFPVDLDEGIQFPPHLIRRDHEPTGHLRPLGHQSRSEGSIEEATFMLTAEKFWDDYIAQNKPTFIRNLVSMSTSVDKWTDHYLNQYYGYLDIEYTNLKESMWEDKKTMKFTDFLKKYRHENYYLRVIMPEVMQSEVPIPSLINCGPFATINQTVDSKPKDKEQKGKKQKVQEAVLPKLAQLVEPYLWISAGDTSSLLHSHPDHNLHCILDGRMDFIFIDKNQFKNQEPEKWQKKLGLTETFTNSNEWVSKIDVDLVNAYKYPALQRTLWHWASLKAGDCVYIPANQLHQIRSHGRSISTSVYFNTMQIPGDLDSVLKIKAEYFSRCPAQAPSFEPMNTINQNFMWAHTHGKRHLKLRNVDDQDLRNYLIYMMRQVNVLYFETFDDFFYELTKEIHTNIEEYADDAILELKSTDFWDDFFLPQLQPNDPYMFLNHINALANKPNLHRFKKLVNLVLHEHDKKFKRKHREL